MDPSNGVSTTMIRLRELLTGNALVTVPPSATVFEASKLMVKEHVGAVLVVDEEGHPCGMFTERDLMSRVVVPGLDPHTAIVGDKMTKDLFCANPENRVGETALKMRKRHIRHLPIVENDLVIAMLSIRDLLYANLHESEEQVEALTTYIQGGVIVQPKED